MIFNAHNSAIPIDATEMPCIRFGSGTKALLMLPGIGDGLRSVQGMAVPMAFLYRAFAREYTVYVLSRRSVLPDRATTRDMAGDVAYAMDMLGVSRADVIGVSMGGMIAQHLAVDHPEKVDRLVLAVSAARPNPTLQETLSGWIAMAERGDHIALMDDNVRRMYTDGYYRRARPLIPLGARLMKPKSYAKFLTMARACLTHDAYASLSRIQSPTLVIGGRLDNTLGGETSTELAAAISGCRLHMYEHLGHSAYEEAPDFNRIALNFLIQKGAPQ